MDPKKIPSWNGRRITKDEDKHDLETRAAVYEFKHRMKRDDAEHRAHHEYKKDKHREAAAHHLAGMKAAQAAGSHDEARKHALMYQMHLEALHHDPYGSVPSDISSLTEKQDHFYRFKPHNGDAFLLQNKPEEESKHDPLEEEGSKELSKSEDLKKGNLIQFPREKISEARDQSQPAKVVPMQQQTECTHCQPQAGELLFYGGSKGLEQAIGPNSTKMFLQKHPHANNPESFASAPWAKQEEARQSLATLLHARHSFQKR